MDEQENGQKFRERIVEAINQHDEKVKNNLELIKFKCSINNDEFEEILSYNDIVHGIYTDKDSEIVWKLKEIISH